MKCKYEGSGVWEGRCTGTKEVDPCPGYDKCKNYKPDCMTNADRIRAMSDEELAKWLADVDPKHCDRNCPAYDVCEGATSKMGCSDYIEKWLKQPYKEG